MKRILIFLWLLFLPTQLGLHFWPEWSHVMGLRVDYLAPTLYFVDILWMIMIVVGGHIGPPLHWIKRWMGDHKGSPLHWIVVIFVLINIFVAENHWEAGYRWLRIFQWVITFNLIKNNKELFREMLRKVLPMWIVGEGLLAVAQVVNGGSLNGIFYWLGERRFSYISLGVAQISYFGEGLIRAYGTFSHPNSMAGYLLVSLILFINNKRHNIFYWIVVFCGMLGLFLSGSRTVWGITIIIFLLNLKLKYQNLKQMLGAVLIAGGLLAMCLNLINANYRISDFVGGWDSEGMTKRGGLLVTSLKMIKDNPAVGVGAGNFLVKLPEYQKNSGVFWLQPVHNIIFLVVTEFGLIGFILLLFFLKKIKYKNNMIVLGIILVAGMVDHYWITLPQNWWLLGVVLGII